MKNKIGIVYLLLISSVLLTGCGTSKKDLEEASNPLEFVEKTFESYYKKEIILLDHEEKTDNKKQKTDLMKYQLENNENFTFNACAYWDVSSPIPNSYYTNVNNYENIYATKFIQEHFKDISYTEVILDSYKTKYNDFCELEQSKITIELKDISNLENLEQELIKIKETKEIYAINIKIKYEDRDVTILISNQSTEENILEELNKLKKS